LRRLPSDIRIGIVLLLATGVLTALSPSEVADAVSKNVGLIVKVLLLSIVAVFISIGIHYLVPPDFAQKHLRGRKLKYLFYATILGILTPGPVYAAYPIVLALKKKGVENPIFVSFITGQTVIGPARIPFEVGLFGLDFFLYRLALALVIGPLAGLLYILFSKWLPDTI
jgi:uncharacterized membrane protein YraQ (UPF0718 family)